MMILIGRGEDEVRSDRELHLCCNLEVSSGENPKWLLLLEQQLGLRVIGHTEKHRIIFTWGHDDGGSVAADQQDEAAG
jgi:hypothetical protein